MYDLFRAIFGEPPQDQNGKRMDETPPRDYRDNFMKNSGDDMGDNNDDDEMGMDPPGGFFGFSIFNDPNSVHRQFERLINEMNKAFGVFGFDSSSSITFEDENRSMPPCNGAPGQQAENLRDLYLKQPESVTPNNQSDQSFINVTFNSETSTSQSSGGVVTKFIHVQKFLKPDGSVEIIQKVRDHTGNEETTITRSNINDPLLPPQGNEPKPKDSSGLSLLRKFFPF